VPDTWANLDMGGCASELSGGLCTHGIWGRFTGNPASEDITCSWQQTASVFAAGSFRYNNVDPIVPIIDVACVAGTEPTATAPSIDTVSGSQVARIYSYFNLDFPPTNDINFNNDTSGSFTSNASTKFSNVSMHGETILVNFDGPTGT